MRDAFKQVTQYGDKSVFVNENTGEIKIIDADKVTIVNPDNREQLEELHKAFGEAFDTIFEKIKTYVKQPSLILRDLTASPFMPELFLGRTKELEAIHQALFEEENMLLLVNGSGGIGKTTLASRYYHQFKTEYKHVAWVLSEKSIAQAILQLATPLKVSFEPDANMEQRLKLLLARMTALPDPCLLVIDNANELDDLEINYKRLRQCTNFHLLLTTRISNFRLAATHEIKGLPKEEALELFKSYYPDMKKEEEPILYAIRDAVYHNTLVLELLAKNINRLNRIENHYSLKEILSDLQDKGLLQLSQSKAVKTDYGNLNHARPEEIIQAMYELGDLSRAEVILLSNFAVLPAEGFTFQKLKNLLPDFQELEDTLLPLAQKGWIEYNEVDQEFKCSPVVQEVVRRQNEELREDCKALISLLNNKLDYEAGVNHIIGSSYEEAEEYVRIAAVIIDCIDIADWSVCVLLERIANYHIATGYLEQGLGYYLKRKQASIALLKNDPDDADYKNGLAISYEKLGEVHSSLGNLEKALSYFEDDVELTKDLNESYPTNVNYKNCLAVSYSKLVSYYRDHLSDQKKAMEYFQLC
ncbi:MAG: NB-ARC domain-containing protein, partial [Chitinophagales bacterium]|nr:NB-ARC domain-containing protein [Chitinophagales bacterium]